MIFSTVYRILSMKRVVTAAPSSAGIATILPTASGRKTKTSSHLPPVSLRDGAGLLRLLEGFLLVE
jgi:hypothetical protein